MGWNNWRSHHVNGHHHGSRFRLLMGSPGGPKEDQIFSYFDTFTGEMPELGSGSVLRLMDRGEGSMVGDTPWLCPGKPRKPIGKWWLNGIWWDGYLLLMTNIAMENSHRNSEFSHSKCWCSLIFRIYLTLPEGTLWVSCASHHQATPPAEASGWWSSCWEWVTINSIISGPTTTMSRIYSKHNNNS